MKSLCQLSLVLIVLASLFSCSSSSSKTDLIPCQSGNNYQYVNRNGEIVINPQFHFASVFSDGLAQVMPDSKNRKIGYIDKTGQISINPIYLHAQDFTDGLAIVVKENSCPAVINTKGEQVFELKQAQTLGRFHNNLAAFSVLSDNKTLWGFVNKKGEVVIEPQFSSVGIFSQKKCAVANESGDWGYIYETGELVINHQFRSALAFHNNMAVVYSGRNAGVIDSKGKYLINPQYQAINHDGDLLQIKQDKKYGWIDTDGDVVIEPQYKRAKLFNSADLAPVSIDNNKWGYINTKGKLKINPQFDKAWPFDGDLAIVRSGGKFGFINDEGEYEVNPQFTGISNSYFYTQEFSNEHRYKTVTTDYFDIDAVVKTLCTLVADNQFSNITFNDDLATIIDKYDLKENTINRYQQKIALSNTSIIKEVTLSSSVNIEAYKNVKTPYTRYNRTYYRNKYVLDKEAQPKSIIYSLSLRGKGVGKEAMLIDAIMNQLDGYTLESKKHNYQDYKSDNYKLRINKNYAGINFTFSPA